MAKTVLKPCPFCGGKAESPGERGSAPTGLPDLPGDCGDKEGDETMKKTTTDTRCTVLCPLGLHRSVKMLAAYRGQSMNKTIIDLLEQGLEQTRSENISL